MTIGGMHIFRIPPVLYLLRHFPLYEASSDIISVDGSIAFEEEATMSAIDEDSVAVGLAGSSRVMDVILSI